MVVEVHHTVTLSSLYDNDDNAIRLQLNSAVKSYQMKKCGR